MQYSCHLTVGFLIRRKSVLCCCALGIPATPSLHVNAQRMYVICLGVCVCVGGSESERSPRVSVFVSSYLCFLLLLLS